MKQIEISKIRKFFLWIIPIGCIGLNLSIYYNTGSSAVCIGAFIESFLITWALIIFYVKDKETNIVGNFLTLIGKNLPIFVIVLWLLIWFFSWLAKTFILV